MQWIAARSVRSTLVFAAATAFAPCAAAPQAPTQVVDLAVPVASPWTKLAIADLDSLPGNEVAVSGLVQYRDVDGALRDGGYVVVAALQDGALRARVLLRPDGAEVAGIAAIPSPAGPDGLAVLLADGTLVEYTGAPLRESRRRLLPGIDGPVAPLFPDALWIGDLSGGGSLDAVVSRQRTFAVRLGDGSQRWEVGAGTVPLVVRNDPRAAARVVLSGFPGLLIDGATGAPAGTLDGPVENPMAAVGRADERAQSFVAREPSGSGGAEFVLRRGPDASRAWSLAIDAKGVAAADADGDGNDEIVVLSETSPATVLDARDGRTIRQLEALGIGPAVAGPVGQSALAMVVLDGTIPGSSGAELNNVVGAGLDGSAPVRLRPQPGPFPVPGFADVDGDGADDLLVVLPGHRDRGGIQWRAPADGVLRGSRSFATIDGGFDALSPMVVGQADTDGNAELFGFAIGSSTLVASTIDLVEWRREASSVAIPASICESRSTLALGGPPVHRRLALGTRLFCPSGTAMVRVLRVPGLELDWSAPLPPALGTEVIDLVPVQADADPAPEWVVAGNLGFGLLDDDGSQRWTVAMRLRGLAAAGEGVDGLRIAGLDTTGGLRRWSAAGMEIAAPVAVSPTARRLVAADAAGSWYLTCEARALAMVRADDGLLLRSTPFGDAACAAGGPALAASGLRMLAAAGSGTSIAIVQFDPGGLFADGFE
jgi:hypothetical protein